MLIASCNSGIKRSLIISKGIEIEPDEAGAYFNRGIVYSKQGDRDNAIADWQKAKEMFAAKGDTFNREQAEELLRRDRQQYLYELFEQ